MEWQRKSKYHKESACGYTISRAKVAGVFKFSAWRPKKDRTPAELLGVRGTLEEAEALCCEHKKIKKTGAG